MTYNETINSFLKANYSVLQIAMNGVSHEESLQPLPGTSSNMNWILGHIILSRNGMCSIIRQPDICDASYNDLFARGTRSDPGAAVQLDELMKVYDVSQSFLLEKVLNYDPSVDRKKNNELAFLCFHEAYHIGQLGLLRRSMGKEGVAG